MLKPPSDLYEEPDDELMGELLLGVGAANDGGERRVETLIGCIARGRRGVVHLGLLLLEVLLCCPLEIEKFAREMMAPCRHTKGGGERCRDPLPLPMPWTLVDKNALLWTFALM